MISFITGKPGGGKGLLSMQQIVDELVKGTRYIICNTPVRIQPWLFGGFTPMMGLKAYLLKTYQKDFDCEKRVHILDDDDTAAFYLWRVLDGFLTKAKADVVVGKDGDERIMGYDTSIAAASGGVLYVIDEAWKFFGSRNWQKTGEGMLYYSAQHRHFGDDVLIVTQHTKQIDPAIQRVAQDFWVVTNHSKLSIGIFRHPDIFSVAIFDQAPTGSAITPMSRKVFKLDKAGLAQTYDTSAGVGLTGRMAADTGARRKGLPWWGMIILVLIIAGAAVAALKAVGWGVGKALSVAEPASIHKAPPLSVPVPSSNEVPAPHAEIRRDQEKPLISDPAKSEVTTFTGFALGDTNTVFCTGFVALGVDVTIYLSDGSTAYASCDDVQQVTPHWVTVHRQRYRVVTGNVFSRTSEQRSAFDSLPVQSPVVDPQPQAWGPFSSVEILPAVNSQASAMVASPRINGMSFLSGPGQSHSQGQQQPQY